MEKDLPSLKYNSTSYPELEGSQEEIQENPVETQNPYLEYYQFAPELALIPPFGEDLPNHSNEDNFAQDPTHSNEDNFGQVPTHSNEDNFVQDPTGSYDELVASPASQSTTEPIESFSSTPNSCDTPSWSASSTPTSVPSTDAPLSLIPETSELLRNMEQRKLRARNTKKPKPSDDENTPNRSFGNNVNPRTPYRAQNATTPVAVSYLQPAQQAQLTRTEMVHFLHAGKRLVNPKQAQRIRKRIQRKTNSPVCSPK